MVDQTLMLSLFLCGLFEWKRNCAGFYRLFIYVLPLKIRLSKGGGCCLINWFNPATCLCLS